MDLCDIEPAFESEKTIALVKPQKYLLSERDGQKPIPHKSMDYYLEEKIDQEAFTDSLGMKISLAKDLVSLALVGLLLVMVWLRLRHNLAIVRYLKVTEAL
ncbi:unnamed protein product [Sphagnum balticum]